MGKVISAWAFGKVRMGFLMFWMMCLKKSIHLRMNLYSKIIQKINNIKLSHHRYKFKKIKARSSTKVRNYLIKYSIRGAAAPKHFPKIK